MDEHRQNLYDVRKSIDNYSFLFVLESRVNEIKDELEDLSLEEKQTCALRGGILEIRNLIDLIASSQDD